VAPALQRLVRTSTNLLARFHALWTLEGLGALDATLVRAAMKDPQPRLRIQAIRASETLYKAGDKSLAADWRRLAEDADADVVIQAMLTLNALKVPETGVTVKLAMNARPARGVQFVGERILNPPANLFGGAARGSAILNAEQQQSSLRGAAIYNELCFSCHGEDGRGTPQPGGSGALMGPSLVGSPRVAGHRDYVIKVLLHGLTGPIDGKSYSEVMVPMGSNNDQWVADIATFLRSSMGNAAAPVSTAEIAAVRAATATRKTAWTVSELSATLPRMLAPDASWKLTASHNTETAADALSYSRWTSGVPQQAGMWLQVEMPAPAILTEIQFESAQTGGARGGPPPAIQFPRAYRVDVSGDGTTWSRVAEGKGTGRITTITFAPVGAKFVRITQTDAAANAPVWSVERLRVFEAPANMGGGSR
jgi:mono/diheme cytochrome c family protein